MSNNNSQGGCCGCLALLISIPFFWFIGHQNFFYQSTGQFDWSLPKIKFGLPEFGTPRSVQQCADYLEEAPYTIGVSIKDRTISFLVDEKGADSLDLTFFPNNGAATDNNASTTDSSTSTTDSVKYWENRATERWSGINKKISTDIRFKCQAPVTVNYTYFYVKRRFTGQVVLQDPKK